MDGLEKGELVVVCVYAGAEEEAGVPPVDDLVVTELDKVGLIFLVAGRYEAVDLVGRKRCQRCRRARASNGVGWLTSPLSLIFSSSLYGAYHLASRVLPLRSRWSATVCLWALAASLWRGDSLAILYEYERQHLGRFRAQAQD